MGYTRIEHEAGGAARLAMSECDSDAIDKVVDARANLSARRGRTPDASQPHHLGDIRRVFLLHPTPSPQPPQRV